MQNKLQELTDKLYNEGLSKGKQEAEELLARAHADADRILADARHQAEQILADARKETEALRKTAENDIAMASRETLSAVRQQTERVVVAGALGDTVAKTLSDSSFVRELLETVVKAFRADDAEPRELSAILPASMQEELRDRYANELSALMGKGVNVRFEKNTLGGFRIGPAEGGFRLDFTDADFTALLSAYLRPATRKILFGE